MSGGGKTTLLGTIAGLLPTAAGSVTLGGAPVLGPSQRTALVFQHFALFPWKTVRGNVAYGLRVQGRRPELARVQRLLDVLHLADVADRFETMRQYKVLTGTAPAESTPVDAGPVNAVIHKLGAWTGDPRWH